MKKIAVLAATAAGLVATPALAHEGPYIGVIGGYDAVSIGYEDESESADEIMYGVVAGYDMALGTSAMLGVEAEYSDSSVKESYLEDGVEYSVRSGRDLYVGARLGFLATPSTMVYAKAGYTNAQAKAVLDNGDLELRTSEEFDGYRVGGGVEHSFDNVGVRLEYRYSDYGNAEVFGFDTGATIDRHQVVAGVLAKF